jgi:hypothetical protein
MQNGRGPGAPVVVAQDVMGRYGEGDSAVDALRGVSVGIAPGKLTVVNVRSTRRDLRRAIVSLGS